MVAPILYCTLELKGIELSVVGLLSFSLKFFPYALICLLADERRPKVVFRTGVIGGYGF